jgi:hypothetical protein
MERTASKTEGGGTKEGREDPMINLMMDKDAIAIMSTLIAKLEGMTFDEGRVEVFRTTWGRNLFRECSRRMTGRVFDIDGWFVEHCGRGTGARSSSTSVRRDIDPSMYRQPMCTDWLMALIDLEMNFSADDDGRRTGSHARGSAMRILHNILELEDSSMTKLSEYRRSETQYHFEGIRSSSSSIAVTSPAAMCHPIKATVTARRIGSIDDLLRRRTGDGVDAPSAKKDGVHRNDVADIKRAADGGRCPRADEHQEGGLR